MEAWLMPSKRAPASKPFWKIRKIYYSIKLVHLHTKVMNVKI